MAKLKNTDDVKNRKDCPPAKCYRCRGPLGEKGIRSRRAWARPGVLRKGRKFFHERCLTP